MPQRRDVDMKFPLSGVSRRFAYQDQAPFTTPDALNVRPSTTEDSRGRGGSRPGLDKSHRAQLGSGNPIRMLSSVSYASGDNHDHWGDRFDESVIGAAWAKGSWAEDLPNMLTPLGADLIYDSGDVAVVAPAVPDIDVSGEYWVEMYIAPYLGSYAGRYRIYARMDDTSPDALDDCVMAEIEMDDTTGDYSVTLSFVDSGNVSRWVVSASPGEIKSGWFSLHINGNLVEVYWLGSQITGKVAHAPIGERVGFGLQSTVVHGVCTATEFRVQYKRNDETHQNARREVLLASADGLLYRETAFGFMEQVTTPTTLVSDRPLAAVDRLDQLFIADNDGGGTVNTKVYAPSTDTLVGLDTLVTAGIAPLDCPLIALYRDRLILAGAKTDPHLWYMSRLGDPYDWDYGASASDLARAVAGTTAEAGKVSTPLTAIIPSSDDYMLFASAKELWVLVGDPTYGGAFDNISRRVGVVDQQGWCFGPEGKLVIMSHDGLYGVHGKQLIPISRGALPRTLANKDPATHSVVLGYDSYHRGIHIFVTSYVDSATTHFWFDWDSKSFWLDSFQVTHEPFVVFHADAKGYDGSPLLIGCRDGYIRRMNDWQETDDGTGFSSYVTYGPIMLGDGFMHEGMIQKITGTFSEESGDVTWSVHTSDTAEKCVKASAKSSGTFKAGANGFHHPRVRGMAMIVKLTGTSGRQWAVESLGMTRAPLGSKRV